MRKKTPGLLPLAGRFGPKPQDAPRGRNPRIKLVQQLDSGSQNRFRLPHYISLKARRCRVRIALKFSQYSNEIRLQSSNNRLQTAHQAFPGLPPEGFLRGLPFSGFALLWVYPFPGLPLPWVPRVSPGFTYFPQFVRPQNDIFASGQPLILAHLAYPGTLQNHHAAGQLQVALARLIRRQARGRQLGHFGLRRIELDAT